jgi:hypothetical protein
MTAMARLSSRRRATVWALLLLPQFAGGCVAPLMTDYLSGSRRQEAKSEAEGGIASDAPVNPFDAKAASLRKAMGTQPMTQEEALAGILDELEEIEAIDPAARLKLLADLKSTPPEDYNRVVQVWKTALDYRRQLALRETQLAMDDAEEPAAAVAEKYQFGAARVVSHRAQSPVDSTSVESIEQSRTVTEAPTARIVEAAPVVVSDTTSAPAAAALPSNRDAMTRLATATIPVTVTGDWRTQLDAAIADLERTVRPQPETVAELHDHYRLRTLQLLAGREQDAYRPIPGASPVQHDYWSKQLFAMAAFLNDAGPQDDKQRAAAALVHLDGARGALAELATLQIRNLAFVEKVEGFGAYAPLKRTQFDPGAGVSLYAEVENFASTSTAEGYETVLATSYQVVDNAGKRIDGAQFPDVTDVCRGRRRDFHLQYGVSLPTRISPGDYRLVLTITDQRSGKIGHAELAFEINAER